MIVCQSCKHKRQYHKKVDGNAWCSVPICACKEFIEHEIDYNRRELHQALDEFLDSIL